MARSKSTMFNHLPFRFIDSTLKVPSAPEAERGVLGLMLDSETAQDAAFQKLTLDSFPNIGNDHRSIFKAMLNLRDQKTTIDLVTLTTELTRMGALDRVGGFEYLNELANLSFLYSSLDDYIKQINDQSLLRVLYSVIDEAVNRYRRYDIDDINDFVGQLSNRINEVAQERRIADFKSLQDIGKEFISKMEAMKESGTGTLTGVNTGYAGLNNLTHGFQKGDLVIVAARPSMGKTAFALNLALNVAQDPHHQHVVGFFSCEMNSHLLMLRLVAMAANVRSDKIQRNTLDKNERIKVSEAINTLRTRRIYIDDTSNININDLIIKARKLKNEQPDLSVIFIDYLGLITTTGKQESRQLEIQKITQQLKELARSLEVTVVCLAQLNRGVEDRDNKVPILSDLRESGSIEQDADVVMLLNREDFYLMNKTLKKEKARYFAYYEETKEQETNDKTGKFLSPSIIDIYIAKNRNGQTGIETLVFFKSSFLISNPDKTLQIRIREMQRGTESPQ
ncbi:MAG: replicative DNA helicase [Bacilli bacterium]|jgi:replicative DNA helicase|nr:replicative DNA helicase [Bacilli bacterium]